jgi:hypothetical protein
MKQISVDFTTVSQCTWHDVSCLCVWIGHASAVYAYGLDTHQLCMRMDFTWISCLCLWTWHASAVCAYGLYADQLSMRMDLTLISCLCVWTWHACFSFVYQEILSGDKHLDLCRPTARFADNTRVDNGSENCIYSYWTSKYLK